MFSHEYQSVNHIDKSTHSHSVIVSEMIANKLDQYIH